MIAYLMKSYFDSKVGIKMQDHKMIIIQILKILNVMESNSYLILIDHYCTG